MPDKRRIVVAEDDAAIRDLVRDLLTSAGYEIHTARNGQEAVLKVRQFAPAAMVLDINMPEIDGFGVLKAIRNLPPAVKPAVLVLTARHSPDDVRQATLLGAKDYLAKPFSQTQLLSRVARLLRPALSAPAPAPVQDRNSIDI